MENTPVIPRRSKFQEGTMNSVNSIHPPPEVYWMELGIDDVIKRANEESAHAGSEQSHTPTPGPHQANEVGRATQGAHVTPAPGSGSQQNSPASHSIFERFSRAASSFFRGTPLSTLGKRKAGEKDAVKDAEKAGKKSSDKENLRDGANDTRKEDYERIYAEAKAQGLLPKPQVFVRPRATPRKATATRRDISTPRESPARPPLRPSTSKKDLAKQAKLSKRVSDLEFKLALARKQLSQVIGEDVPPVPALPPTPNTATTTRSDLLDEEELGTPNPIAATITAPVPEDRPKSSGKITKKRKATATDESSGEREYKPITTESDYESDSLATSSERKNTKRVRVRRSSSRLTKKRSTSANGTTNTSTTKEENIVTIVPNGDTVPPIPEIPSSVRGKRAAVSNSDGFGGFGHEIF